MLHIIHLCWKYTINSASLYRRLRRESHDMVKLNRCAKKVWGIRSFCLISWQLFMLWNLPTSYPSHIFAHLFDFTISCDSSLIQVTWKRQKSRSLSKIARKVYQFITFVHRIVGGKEFHVPQMVIKGSDEPKSGRRLASQNRLVIDNCIIVYILVDAIRRNGARRD